MHLDAFGVESSGFPTISAKIDFTTDTSSCEVSYYEPWLKEKKYSFSKEQIGIIKMLLENGSLKKLKEEYTENVSDQPTSTTIIYTTADTFKIKDYGLLAEYPLPDLYTIVYDLKTNFR